MITKYALVLGTARGMLNHAARTVQRIGTPLFKQAPRVGHAHYIRPFSAISDA